MLPTSRGLPPIDEVCAKHGAHLAFRLRCEYLPGAAPFPDSPEEAEWLAKRETLVLTVLAVEARWVVRTSWVVGGEERGGDLELPRGELVAWTEEIETRGGWELPSLAAVAAGEGVVDLEHEAYEYRDSDPDSLDLESWRPPRHWRTVRAAEGASVDRTRVLVCAYGRFLPEAAHGSPLAAALGG
jgi:hypothetical protein